MKSCLYIFLFIMVITQSTETFAKGGCKDLAQSFFNVYVRRTKIPDLTQNERRALDAYQAFRHYKINDYLRECKGSVSSAFKYFNDISSLDSLIMKFDPVREDTQLWRGIRIDEGSLHRSGEKFVEYGFMSTTFNKDLAESCTECTSATLPEFRALVGVVAKIVFSKGNRVRGALTPLDTFELEVLLERGCVVEVIHSSEIQSRITDGIEYKFVEQTWLVRPGNP